LRLFTDGHGTDYVESVAVGRFPITTNRNNSKGSIAMSYQPEVPVAKLDDVIADARILVVDDDDILRGVNEAVLSLAGYGTDSAADGEEALAMLAIGDFDLVLTDCNMPRLDGIGLVRAMRAAGNRTPIMMVSGSLAGDGKLPEDVHREVTVALPKPLRTLELLAGVARALAAGSPAPAGS
jgi:CheY-like chemotaxis protein